MTTQPKLPAWTGDLEDDCTLRVADWGACCKRIRPASEPAFDERWAVTISRLSAKDTFFRGDEHPGLIIGGDMARAICEAVIREALRADEAEAKGRQLAVQVHNLLPIEDVIKELAAEVPPEDWAKLETQRKRVEAAMNEEESG